MTGLDDLSRPVPATGPVRRRGAAPGARAVGRRRRPAGGRRVAARRRAHAHGGVRERPSSPTARARARSTVDQLASAYSFSSLYPGNEGAGVTVGIYELEPFLQSDINTFKNCYSPAITASVSGGQGGRRQPQRRLRGRARRPSTSRWSSAWRRT